MIYLCNDTFLEKQDEFTRLDSSYKMGFFLQDEFLWTILVFAIANLVNQLIAVEANIHKIL